MQIRYNVSGERRKAMVKVVSEALYGWTIEYLGVPSCSYRVGDFEITRDGTLIFDDSVDYEYVERVLDFLAKKGFESETAQEDIAEMTEPDGEYEKEEMLPETAEDKTPAINAETSPTTAEEEPPESIQLSISLPRESFTNAALDNLDGLLESKGNLIKKAFNIADASYIATEEKITFPWFSGEISAETSRAFQDFVSKLCDMAKKQKRVTAKAKAYENEKYAFRCFLLRLGLIGDEYKTSRKILLKNLNGNSSWRDGRRREETTNAVSEQS
ncbi:MAG: hypothetical protein IKN43_05935 [Selenomonadaceae bacterium]|nr:hypothetical protein [Selenomonadaceae bacterium]